MSRLTPFRAEYGCGFIDEQTFNAAQRPIRDILVDDRPRFLTKRAPCPVCGRNLQCHRIEGKYDALMCTSKHDGEYVGVVNWYSAAAVEMLILGDIKRLVDRDLYNEAYLATIADENGHRVTDLEKLIKAKDAEIGSERHQYKAALKRHVTSKLAGDLEAVLLEMKDDIERLERERERLREALFHRRNLIVDDRSAADQLIAVIEDIAESLPWRPEGKEELEVFAIARALLGKVQITERDDGLQDIAITYNLTEQSPEHPAITTTINHEGCQVLQRVIAQDAIRQTKADAFTYSADHLTDEEFSSLPLVIYNQREEPEISRKLLDILLVASTSEVSNTALLRHFDLMTYQTRLAHFYASPGFEALEEHLQKTRGEGFKIKSPGDVKTGFNERVRLIAAKHPALLLPIADPKSGVTEVSDDDWELVFPIFASSVNEHTTPEMLRTAFNAYFYCVRNGRSLAYVRKFGLGRKRCQAVRFPSSRSKSFRVLKLLLPRYGYDLPTDFKMPEIEVKKAFFPDEEERIAEIASALISLKREDQL